MDTSEVELSEREREILCLVATGASNKQIAQQLVISTNTVKVHLRNIFSKIGVASRTEATLYAIRKGLVPAPGDSTQPSVIGENVDSQGIGTSIQSIVPSDGEAASQPRSQGWSVYIAFPILILAIGLAAYIILRPLLNPVAPPQASSRWQIKAALPLARSGLAAAVFDDQIYAIGGETGQGVTGEVDRYTPSKDVWEKVTPLPIPVRDVSAAVLGGKIYIPGGRTTEGKIFDQLQVYDPDNATWETKAKLPIPLYGYALAPLEGKIYLFGGMTSTGVISSVYAYNPDTDQWMQKANMPTARGYAGAAVVGGGICVVGGTDGHRGLAANEVYTPEKDIDQGKPWQTMQDLPKPVFGSGVVSILDYLYVIGGGSTNDLNDNPMVYQSSQNTWVIAPKMGIPTFTGQAAVTSGNTVFVMGGKDKNGASSQVAGYQVIYTIALPGVSK
jgi:DNA-binding CsgD family transcriptional regulator/N-acetylneuraminic acid mutarotase